MNQVMENIKTRRSTRAFLDKQVDVDMLKEIVTAGLYAPSARNHQNWQLTVVQDPDILMRLQNAIAKVLDRSDYTFYNAPTMIIVSVPRDYSFGTADSACVLENIFLAAHSMRIQSVWINQLMGICDKPEIRIVLNDCEVPDDHVSYGCAALGYAVQPTPADRDNRGKVVYIK